MNGKKMYKVFNSKSKIVLAKYMEPADTFWTRFVRLLESKKLPINTGLWLKPYRDIHLFSFNYPRNQIFQDKNISKVSTNNTPNWFSTKRQTNSVIELLVGTIYHLNVKARDQLNNVFYLVITNTNSSGSLYKYN
ncbi:MAG: DUF192 domain-containing protein [Methylococcales bacterium]|nr:DUF192 domain-containing protein [Methylococcales bacterium]